MKAQRERELKRALRWLKCIPPTKKVQKGTPEGPAYWWVYAAWLLALALLGVGEGATAFTTMSNSSSALADSPFTCVTLCAGLILSPIAIAQLRVVFAMIDELQMLARTVLRFGLWVMLAAFVLFAAAFSGAHGQIDFSSGGGQSGGVLFFAFTLTAMTLQAIGLFAAKICCSDAFYRAYGYEDVPNQDYELAGQRVAKINADLKRHEVDAARYAALARDGEAKRVNVKWKIVGEQRGARKREARQRRIEAAEEKLREAKEYLEAVKQGPLVLMMIVGLAGLAGCDAKPQPPASHEQFFLLDDTLLGELRDEAFQIVQRYYASEASPGERVHAVAADPDHRTVFSVTVPDKPWGNPRLRDRAAAKEFARLVEWLKTPGVEGPGQPGLGRLTATVNSLKRSDLPNRVAIIGGDPCYDETEGAAAGWRFRRGYVANDAALSSEKFPLRGAPFTHPTVVSWRTPTSFGDGPEHRAAVVRFWVLWARSHNGRLCRATDEAGSVLDYSGDAFANVEIDLAETVPAPRLVARPTDRVIPAPTAENLNLDLEVLEDAEAPQPSPDLSTREGRMLQLGAECLGNVLLVDHSPSLVCEVDAEGKLVIAAERQAGFDRMRKKLGVLVRTLPVDWINAIVFSGRPETPRTEAHAPVMLEATDENRQKMAAWLMSRQIGAGTAMLPAIEKALAWPQAEVLTLVSDGMPTGEEEQQRILDLISGAHERSSVRVNVIAVGNLDQTPGQGATGAYTGIEFLQRVADQSGGVLVRW